MLRIGIDLGGTKTEGIVMDDTGAILFRHRCPTPRSQGYDAILANIARLVAQLEDETGGRARVGIATPGACDPAGRLKNSNTTCLNGRPVQADLEHLLDRPIRVANDANCFALSEALDGAGRNADSVFGIIMGTGVGGGIVIRGQLHEGLQQIAGEWGHNVLEPDGPPCYCGRNGCVETFLSGPGLEHDYQVHGGITGLNAEAIVAQADEGETRAKDTMDRFLERFGRALAPVINILDPHVVVLGGGLSHIARLYSDGCQALARQIFNNIMLTPILPNVYGDSSGVRGAAQLWAPGKRRRKARPP